MNRPPGTHDARRRLLPLAIAVATTAGLGVGLVGGGTAFAQGAPRTQVSATAASHLKVSKHERIEAPSVRASETSSTDPLGTSNEPTDVSSNDPSPKDETANDTSVSDVNDSADTTTSPGQSPASSTSLDQSSLTGSTTPDLYAGHRHHHHR